MTSVQGRRSVVTSLALAAATGWVLSGSGAAVAREAAEIRMRELEPRVRTYSIRSESLDGAERDERTHDERTVTFDADVLFAFDSDELDSQARSRLDDLAGDLQELGPREVAVSGHTDSTGSARYNQNLSERRAESVRAALAGELGGGFAFDVTGYGETEPVADNDSEEGQAQNRRVEIRFSTE